MNVSGYLGWKIMLQYGKKNWPNCERKSGIQTQKTPGTRTWSNSGRMWKCDMTWSFINRWIVRTLIYSRTDFQLIPVDCISSLLQLYIIFIFNKCTHHCWLSVYINSLNTNSMFLSTSLVINIEWVLYSLNLSFSTCLLEI